MNPTYLGIDFGTTKTLVSRFNERKNEPQTVRLGRGHDFVPTSVLAGGNDSFIFGDEADDQFAYNPSSYARAFKLKLGGSTYVLSYRDEKTRKRCTAAYLTQKYLEYILRECKDNSYACDRAVLTRPVKFTPDQLAQLEEAAHAAGLREVEFITEPQAAAYAYCNERPAEAWQNALVVDWGGGTLDMALVSKTAKGVVVHEKYCDGMLRGGEDFDDALFLLAETAIKRGEDAPMWKALEKDKLDLGWTLTTRVRIRQAKEDLSRSGTKPLPLRSCEGRAYKPVQLKKEDFEKSIMPDLTQAAKRAKKLIDSIQEKSLKPSVILLVGGSCKIPAVADALQKATGVDKEHIKTWDQADEAVSLGAALYAHKLWGTQTDSPAPQREATPPPVTPDNSSDNVFIGVKPSSIFSRPGSDLRYDLDITLDEAMSGCDKVLEIERLVPCDACAARGSKDSTKGYKICSTCHGSGVITQQSGFSVQQSTCPSCSGLGQIISNPCSKCHGEGRVHKDVQITLHVPAGVDTGTKLRSSGNGDAGLRGGETGDLYVFIEVKPHEFFQREGKDLSYTMPIPFALAAQGGVLSVPTPDGTAKLKLPAGTSSGTIFRVRGKGMPALGGGSRGDLMVEIQVETSTNLNVAQGEKLESLYRKGVRLLYGIGVERDPQRAVQCFREGYAKGDLNASYMLAACLREGDGTARDFDEAFQIASDLANKNFYPAYYYVANAYMSGRGVAMNQDVAGRYYEALLKCCSTPLPGVDESIRCIALMTGTMAAKEIDARALLEVARRNLESSDWPMRYGYLALSLSGIDEESASVRQKMFETIEAGCAENDVLSFRLKAFVQANQEQYDEAKQTVKRGLKLAPGYSNLWDLMLEVAVKTNNQLLMNEAKQGFWEACALGVSAIKRNNDLGVKIEIVAPSISGGRYVYREDIAQKLLNKNAYESLFSRFEPIIIVKNTNDRTLKGATLRLCSADVGLDKTYILNPIPPHGEMRLEASDLDDIQYGKNLYVRVSEGDRYSEMDLETTQGLDDFRHPFMPLMLTWKSGTFGGYILQLKCLEGSLSNIVVTKQSGATAHIPSLEGNQEPATVGWLEFSDSTSLTLQESFAVQCDGFAPVAAVILQSVQSFADTVHPNDKSHGKVNETTESWYDDPQILEFYKKGAAVGHPESLFQLGCFYLHKGDVERAKDLLCAAAGGGHSGAKNMLQRF